MIFLLSSFIGLFIFLVITFFSSCSFLSLASSIFFDFERRSSNISLSCSKSCLYFILSISLILILTLSPMVNCSIDVSSGSISSMSKVISSLITDNFFIFEFMLYNTFSNVMVKEFIELSSRFKKLVFIRKTIFCSRSICLNKTFPPLALVS